MRLDQWLWAVRLYRSRTLATHAIQSGHVKIDGQTLKPAREVRAGEIVSARTGSITRIYRVMGFPASRVGAPQVAEYAQDITPPPPPQGSQADVGFPTFHRPKGSGRPTKRERRTWDQFHAPEA